MKETAAHYRTLAQICRQQAGKTNNTFETQAAMREIAEYFEAQSRRDAEMGGSAP